MEVGWGKRRSRRTSEAAVRLTLGSQALPVRRTRLELTENSFSRYEGVSLASELIPRESRQ
jgi:hypothetical protein